LPIPFDVIVIGAGPAGLIAAGQAALHGARSRVLLLEKMAQPGKKLALTGNTRCNLTNAAPVHEFVTHFGPNGRFLRSVFAQFFSDDLLAFFKSLGIHTATEPGGRIFPASNQAQDVVNALVRWTHDLGVTLWTGASAEHMLTDQGRIVGVQLTNAQIHHAHAVLLTTGGASFPSTGSTGDGFRLAEALGHTIIPLRPNIIPLKTAGNVAQRLQGLSLSAAPLTLWINNKKFVSKSGDMLFTHFGVSGPAILSLSLLAVDALRAGHPVKLSIDLVPDCDDTALETYLLRELNAHGKQQISTLLKDLLPRTLIPVCCDLLQIPEQRLCHQITAAERRRLRAWLKAFDLDIIGHPPLAAAYVTAGGIDLREVDPRTMQSKLISGLYFAGEVLDLDADTGGYNLQAAFSTGWVAGRSATQQ